MKCAQVFTHDLQFQCDICVAFSVGKFKLLLHSDHSACQYKSAQFNGEGSAEFT